MARIEIEKKLADVSEMPQWRFLKEWMLKELDDVTNLDKITSFEEMCGAKFCRKWVKEIIRKIDGAKDALTFK